METRMSMYARTLLLLLLAAPSCEKAAHSQGAAAADVPAASRGQAGKAGATADELRPVNVEVRKVDLTSLTEYLSLSGETMAEKTITYSAAMPGRLEKLTVDHGERVKKGQLLARVDFEMLSAQVDQARTNLELAEKTHARLRQLRDKDLISQQQVDEAEARVANAGAGLKIARAQLGKCVLRSSIDGFVARKMAEVGEYLNPGQPIVMVVAFSTIVVKAHVPESQVARVRRGQRAVVSMDSLGKDFEGTVHVVFPAAHPTSKTFELRVKVPNPRYEIRVGMAATVRIATNSHDEVVVVPQDAVIEARKDRAVFVEKDSKAIRRVVLLGPAQESRVVIASGLAAGENLIVSGQRSLVDGQPVVVVDDSEDRPSAGTASEGKL